MTHALALLKLCRLCGGNISKYRVSYRCTDYIDEIKKGFGIDVLKDMDEVHPESFCDCCYASLQRKMKAVEECRVMLTYLKPVKWGEHVNEDCETCKRCDSVRKGGRPKKGRKNRGKPAADSCHTIIEHIRKLESPSLYNNPESFTINSENQLLNLSKEEYTCIICNNTLNNPVITSCSILTCVPCIVKSIEALP